MPLVSSMACKSSISSTKKHRLSVEERDALLALQEQKKRDEIVQYLTSKFYEHTFFIQGFYESERIEAHHHHMWDEAGAAHGFNIPLGAYKPKVNDSNSCLSLATHTCQLVSLYYCSRGHLINRAGIFIVVLSGLVNFN